MNMIENAGRTGMLVFIAVCAYKDVKSGKISVVLIAAGMMASVIFGVISGHTVFPDLLVGAAPGLFLVVVSALSSQALGLADSLIITAAGLLSGLGKCLVMLTGAFGTAVIFSVILMLAGKKKWKDSLRFVPFLLMGYVFALAAGE